LTHPQTRAGRTTVLVRLPGAHLLTGHVHDGESLRATAIRLVDEHGQPSAEPVATDLSGQEALFSAEPRPLIGFRPMATADLDQVMAWQARPHVARWYRVDDPATSAVRYRDAIEGRDPTRMWVMEVNGRSAGFVQDYRIGDHPEYAIATGAPDAIGFDYAIGERHLVGRGIGTQVLWRFLCDVVRPSHPEAAVFFAAPDHRNAASLRVLDKLGFTRGVWFDERQPDGSVDTVVSCTLDVRRVLG
jgi:RimJ/RimL family protein N-acetyltransferase